MSDLEHIIQYFRQLQDNICASLEMTDGLAGFQSDLWERPEGGGGDTRLISDGRVFEKGGVNFSHVHGPLPEVLKSETRSAAYFHATGVSIVIHPQNPFVPVIHMNVRYFEMSDSEHGPPTDAWFGGGIDLTPSYVFEEDARFFHGQMKAACDESDPAYYPKFKKWCDEYFYIPHRREMRGIGGIFYDHLRPKNAVERDALFAFTRAVGNSFAPAYNHIVRRRMDMEFGEHHKHWQCIRRGRYAEFNLVYDRGTSFGLKTNGRVESILMSLPPRAHWVYDHHPEPGSAEAAAVAAFQPRDWLAGS